MVQGDPIPAAQYLRMSTERQEYSLDNQAAALARYAEEHGFAIVRTYQDAGRSGLTIRERKGLKDLLTDVVGGHAGYRAVLVYDVSRWGRFQDLDEAAHYEWLCKSEGIPVHYAAEQFGGGDGMANVVLKALKRTMAAEYSRELGVKVYAGKKRLAALGFHEGGAPGYGLRRVMVSAEGRVKQVLRDGDNKSLTTDRVLLTLGPAKEVRWVKWLYSQAIKGRRPADLVKELNLRKVPWQNSRPWTLYAVSQVLTSPKYAGVNLWGRTSSRLQTKAKPEPMERWVVKRGAFPAIVSEQTFDKAQKALRNQTYYHSNAEIIRRLKRLLKSRGVISESMIDRCRSLPSVNTLRLRFGSMKKVYDLIGFHPPSTYTIRAESSHLSDALRKKTISQIQAIHPRDAALMKENGRLREVIVCRGLGAVSLLLCRSYKERGGLRYWMLFTRPSERGLPALVCLLSPSNESVEAYYVVPNIDALRKLKLTPNDPWFRRGIKLRSLADLRPAVKEVREWVPLGLIPRRSGAMAQLMGGPDQRTRAHDAERSGAPVVIRANTLPCPRDCQRDPTVVREAIRIHSWGQGSNAKAPIPRLLASLGTDTERRGAS